ncbi:hypothetical protein GBF35_28070 [Nonomuraea phyllanthi]|uniref:hypothetical protein n=1 Tax=Nonomuraea phyllanthi TaxID=2219224 RepID=UPI0012939EC1|nr:hypothetical protein [Nonomuraea phyllanthi]QFY09984.1 hypothetical protein GBF35_28070 [Nonomuraea phyllanthi]
MALYPWLARIRVRAQVQGAGGGSAGANAVPNEAIARAGGAGGDWGKSLIQASALGASESVVVGAGGVENNPGSSGGPSSFGGFVTAAGGDGSVASMTSGTGLNTVTGTPGPLAGTGQHASGGGGGNGAIGLAATQAPAGDPAATPGPTRATVRAPRGRGGCQFRLDLTSADAQRRPYSR